MTRSVHISLNASTNLSLSASINITVLAINTNEGNQPQKAADVAMPEAKDYGKNPSFGQ
jgi:hypothetical protein